MAHALLLRCPSAPRDPSLAPLHWFRCLRDLAPEPVWLDGGVRAWHPQARRWAMASGPVERFEQVETGAPSGPPRTAAGLFERWEAALGAPEPITCEGPPPPWAPHWFGLFTYEAGAFADRVATLAGVQARFGMPLARWARYAATLVGRVGAPGVWLVADDAALARRWEAALRRASALRARGAAAPLAPEAVATSALRSDRDERAYAEGIRRALEAIAAGDVYQVNVAVRFSAARGVGDPLALFAALRARRPAPYAAYFEFDGAAVVSASPECLLRFGPEGALSSLPIKGTAPARDAVEAEGAGRRLLSDAKERAEHVMIVDLVRNDLGRVAATGTVSVAELAVPHHFPGLVHLVSEVRAQAALGTGPAAWLRALFPGGSVTGAPKLKATELIAEIEGAPRGVYCGAIGAVERGGGGVLNLPIRTAVLTPEALHVHAGGGIVADSQPGAEWREVLLKAASWATLLGRPLE